MKPLLNTKPGIRALQEMVDTIQYYPPGVLLFEAEEPKTMLIKGEVPMLVSWTSTGKRVGDPNQSLIVDKAGFGVLPGHQVDGKIIRAVTEYGGALLGDLEVLEGEGCHRRRPRVRFLAGTEPEDRHGFQDDHGPLA